MEGQNQFQIDGLVEQFDAETGVAVIKQITKRPSGNFENLLEVHVPSEMAELVKPGSLQSFVGYYSRLDGEPRLEVVDIEPAEEHFNLGLALVKLGGVEFFKANPKKKQPQFSSLYGYDVTNPETTITAIAFRGLASTVRSLAEGTMILFGGQLRRKVFSDGSGRYSTDIILDTQHTEIIQEAATKQIRAVTAKPAPASEASVKEAEPAEKKTTGRSKKKAEAV